MTDRWRDHKNKPDFVFKPWMKTVDDLEDQIDELVAALKSARGLVVAFTGADDAVANAIISGAEAAIAKVEQYND